MAYVNRSGLASRKSTRRVNFLLDADEKGRRWQEKDLWSTTRRLLTNKAPRWEAFEKWQREARLAQAKTVDGQSKLPRKLSLKAIFNK